MNIWPNVILGLFRFLKAVEPNLSKANLNFVLSCLGENVLNSYVTSLLRMMQLSPGLASSALSHDWRQGHLGLMV